MTRRRILFAVMAFIAIAIAIIVLKEPPPDSNLAIVLRCDKGVSGTLSVVSLVPDCKGRQIEEGFDVEAACEKRDLEYSHYRNWADVLFTLKRDSGEITRLTSEYGPRGIQSNNHDGFYVVIAISNAPPFLANENL